MVFVSTTLIWFFLDETRNRNHKGELAGLALVIARHGDGGLLAVPRQDDLRRMVEHLGVGLGHVEAAEGARRPGGDRKLSKNGRKSHAGLQSGTDVRVIEILLGWWESIGTACQE